MKTRYVLWKGSLGCLLNTQKYCLSPLLLYLQAQQSCQCIKLTYDHSSNCNFKKQNKTLCCYSFNPVCSWAFNRLHPGCVYRNNLRTSVAETYLWNYTVTICEGVFDSIFEWQWVGMEIGIIIDQIIWELLIYLCIIKSQVRFVAG